jgi:hypothetical protein
MRNSAASIVPDPLQDLSTSPTGARPSWSRRAALMLIALLLAHATLIVVTIARLFPESPYNPPDTVNLRQLVTVTLLAFLGLAFGERQRPGLAVGLGALAVAVALFRPGTVLSALLILLDAWLVGIAVLRAVQRATGERDPIDAAWAVLCGLAIAIGLLAVSGRFTVHYPVAYAAVLALPLMLSLRRLPDVLGQAASLVAARSRRPPSERIWLALLATVIVVHLFVAAKPEVGFDAHTMHLQFARMLAVRHAWTYDVTRFAWAVMPLGADWMFALAYLLDGEACARLLNLAFGLVAGRILYSLIRTGAGALPALIGVTLFASAPLAYLVTGALFSETLWCAFLMGTLTAAVAWLRTRSAVALAALYLSAAGALQTKAISLLWLAPLCVWLAIAARGAALRWPTWPLRLAVIGALFIGAWPYANAAWRTGNPLFPFFNSVFRSPLFDTSVSFENVAYRAPLLPWTPYALVMNSGRFLEGAPGAPGFHWLLLIPIIAAAYALRRRRPLQWACIALGAAFFVLVFVQQSYLRYLLPALLVAAAAGGWALHDLPDRRAVRIGLTVAGVVLIAVNLRFMYTASWFNANLCRRCSFDAQARQQYIAHYAPLRVVSDWLNANLPDARVGFFLLDPSPAGYVGYSRAWSWHDSAGFRALKDARAADDVLALARGFGLTHVVVRVVTEPYEAAIVAFRDRDTRPMWQFDNYRVAVVAPAASPVTGTTAAR